MKNIIILLFCFKLFTLTATAQNSFEFTYGTNEDETLLNAIEDFNNNVIIVGRVGDRSNYNYDPLIMKVYPDGNYIVNRLNLPDTNGYFRTITLLEDSNYLVTGTYNLSTGFEHEYFWVCKFDTNLNILFEKTYKMVDGNFYHGIAGIYSIIDHDANIVIAASKSYDVYYDMCFIKLNQQGDTLLTKTHHFQWEQDIMNISCIPGSKDYLCVVSKIGLHNNGPIRFDSAFNILDIKYFYGSFKNKGTSDHWLNDTTYMYSCLTVIRDSAGKQQDRISVYSIDTALRYHKGLLLDKPDTSDYPAWKTSMAYANDSTIYIGGFINYLEFYSTKPNCIELYLIDTALNLLGYNEYGWDANYDVWGMVSTSDNGCLLYGNYRTESNTTESDIHILKVRREDFDIITSVKTVANVELHAKAWPNPARNQLYIELPKSVGERFTFQIINLAGKVFTSRTVNGQGNVLDINIQPLPVGTYVYQIVGNGHKISGKFIKID